MSITASSVFMVQHRHTQEKFGDPSHSINLPLKNPLYRNSLTNILSYIPGVSTVLGIKTLLGISSLEKTFLLRTGYPGDRCQLSPCTSIREQLPKIQLEAWLETFGIKGIYSLCLTLYKIFKFLWIFLWRCCGNQVTSIPSLPEPLTPQPAPCHNNLGNEIDKIFS